MVSTPRSGDAGITSVIAVVMLLAIVVLCGAIISLLVLQSVQDAAPTTLHAQFQASADSDRLYLTGGDVLPIADLTFYDTNGNEIGVDSDDFSNGGSSGIWTPGEYVTIPEDKTLGSIVARDARGNSVLVYRAGSSTSLPTGDMVPDWWSDDAIPTWTPDPVVGPALPPFPNETLGSVSEFVELINVGGGDHGIMFDKKQLVVNGELLNNTSYPPPTSSNIFTIVTPKGGAGKHSYVNITVNIYGLSSDKKTYVRIWNNTTVDCQGQNDVKMDIPSSKLQDGNLCYLTVERGNYEGHNNKPPYNPEDIVVEVRQTFMIWIISP